MRSAVVAARTGSGGPASIKQRIVGDIGGRPAVVHPRDEEDVEHVVRDEEQVQKDLRVFHPCRTFPPPPLLRRLLCCALLVSGPSATVPHRTGGRGGYAPGWSRPPAVTRLRRGSTGSETCRQGAWVIKCDSPPGVFYGNCCPE